MSIIFVGSHNATKISKDLLNQFPENLFLNFTSRLSFNQTAEVIRRSEAFLCCDGGLMHAAIALNVNIVPLFARLTAEMLVVKGFEFYTLFDSHDVNNIKVNDILLKYYDVVNPAYNHLRDE